MQRTVGIIVALVVGCACASGRTAVAPPATAAPPVPPASTLPGMTTGEARTIDAAEISSEATHPDELHAVLDEAGFEQGAERSFTGGRDSFSRVVARGLTFSTEAGAASYLAWFEAQATTEIIAAERIRPRGLPPNVVVLVREPSGCCHNEVPTYLVVWQRGPTVLSVDAAGRGATTRALVDLVLAIDEGA